MAEPLADNPVYFASYINSGKNRSQGFEAAAHLDRGNWQANIGYSLIQSDNRISGEDYVAFPKWMLKSETVYQASDRHSLALRADLRGDQYSTTIPAPRGTGKNLPTYLRFDIAYQRKITEDISLNLTVADIFNRENRIPSVVDNSEGEPDYGRLIDISLKITW